MSSKQIFKKVLIPCAAGLTANGHTYGPNCVKKNEELKKPSELPIYSQKCNVCASSDKKKEAPNAIEDAIGNVRRELWVWQDSVGGYRQKFVDAQQESFKVINCPGGEVPEKCVGRNHLEHSLDENCYPLLPCPDVKPPKTREVKEFKCFRPSWPIGKKPQRACVERCTTEKPPPKQTHNHCPCCRECSSACPTQK